MDNTLYDQHEYEYKVFKLISEEVQKRYGLNGRIYYKILVSMYNKGIKERLFDKAFMELDKNLPNDWEFFIERIILPIYRHSNVEIKPWKEAVKILEKLRSKHIIIALITNGNVEVQRNKIRLLKIGHLFDKIYISDSFIPPLRKPLTGMFELFLKDFDLEPSAVIHIGDDEKLDGSCEKLGIKFIKAHGKNDWCKISKLFSSVWLLY